MSHRKDTDYLSVSARIRAMENRLLTRERMDRMIDAADDGEARKVLAECGYPEGGSLDQALAQARADVFRDMESAVPDPRLVEIFQLKYDYHNGKTLLKAAAMGRDPQPILLPGGRYDPAQLTDEPNGNARKLKRCGGNTVTIIMKGRHNSFFMEILDRITLLLSELEEVVSCQIIDEDGDEVAEALKFVRDKTSKAIIFLGANLALFDERMNELDIPCVVATTSAKELAFDNVSSVCVDDETATMELVQYLTGYGHKDIVVMGGEISDKQISFSRYLGCKKGFEKSGLEFDPDKNYMACRYSYEAGYETTKRLLEKNIHVTAIVGLSDTIAVGAIRAIEDAGKKVPDDISVVGFDGTVISRFYTPRITSMGQDINSIAKRSVELLMKHIHYTLGCEHDYAPHNLIEGESVRRV